MVACAGLAAAGAAVAATGDPSYRGCITGNTAAGPDGSDACAEVPGAEAVGGASGLNGPSAVAASRDGKSVYVASEFDDAIVQFKRNAKTGALAFVRCVSGNTAVGPTGSEACSALSESGVNGALSGVDGPRSLAISRDDGSVYSVSENDDALSHFTRARSGRLTFEGCVSARGDIGDACELLPAADGIGTDTGMDSPQAVVVSPDGKSVYVGSETDDAVATFRRAQSGELTYRRCLAADPNATACDHLPGTEMSRGGAGLFVVTHLAISRDGKSLYAVANADTAVTRFSRAANGRLGFQGCRTAELDGAGSGGTGACSDISSATATGANSGMDSPTAIAVSPDDDSVYVASQTDAAITHFDRRRSGALVFATCLSGEDATGEGAAGPCKEVPAHQSVAGGNNSGMAAISGMAFAGKSHLYASLASDHGLAHLKRRPASGRLSFEGCITGEIASGPDGTGACDAIDSVALAGAGSGLDNLSAVVTAPGRTSAYTASRDDDAVARFALKR